MDLFLLSPGIGTDNSISFMVEPCQALFLYLNYNANIQKIFQKRKLFTVYFKLFLKR